MSSEKTKLRDKAGKEAASCPHRAVYFSEDSVDGFREERPYWVAYCPECDAKLGIGEHEECPYYRNSVIDQNGTVTVIYCAFPRDKK